MRLAIRLIGLGLIAAVALVGCASAAAPSASPKPSPTASPKPVAISIKSFAFNPVTIEVPKGTTVTWTNEDAVNHTVTTGTPPPTAAPAASGAAPTPSPSLSTGDGKVNSGRIQAANAFSFTFNEAGTYAYFCAVHPRMVATITVR
jgi:plastocyanin